MGFSFVMFLPLLIFMTAVSSLCKNMWISLGIGTICLFMTSILQNGGGILSYLPFMMPMKIYPALQEAQAVRCLIISCGETVGFWSAGNHMFKNKEEFHMSFLSLTGVELKKIRRSGILWILVIPIFLIWLTGVINADINFTMGNEGISPENNFFIQSFMGYAWFMYPASIVISTVMLIQTERRNRGILKMLALPVSAARLCLGKVLCPLLLAAAQMLFMTLAYFPQCSHCVSYSGL